MQFPFVRLTLMDRESHLPVVTATGYQGALDMTKYLIELGRTRIAYVINPLEQRAAQDRFSGYFKSGYEALMSLLFQEYRPTAFSCNNDEMAAGAMSAVFETCMNALKDICIAVYLYSPFKTGLASPHNS